MLDKKWVFKELVKDDRDFVGLLAYAMYKHKKHTLASTLRDKGNSEDVIIQRTQDFHDNALDSNSLRVYQEEAKTYLNSLIANIEQEHKTRFEKEKNTLEAKLKADLRKQKKELIDDISKYKAQDTNWPYRIFVWILSGMPSAVAAIIITLVVYAGAMAMAGEDQKKEVISEMVQKLSGVSTSIKE
ncbi:hypothetical protein [Marinomonas primoryensis]|uniref:hypothetical protein n=1 Tax=Marinomonas primoryensis TaxID=178399 RepID=UPI00370428B3